MLNCSDTAKMKHRYSVSLHFLLFAILFLENKGIECINSSALLEELFTKYHPTARPICGVVDEAIEVKVGLAVRQIIDLNEPRQILELNTWVRMRWNDCNLRWNKTKHRINSMTVPFGTIWVPDLTLYDSVDGLLEGLRDYQQKIYSNGDVLYNFPSIIRVLCKVDVTYFPFDTQICKLKFGSWIHDGFEINITMLIDTADTTMFFSNGEWDVIKAPAVRTELIYLCCPEPYPDVTFHIHLARLALFYLWNLLFPCALITAVAILGFILPSDSTEKVTLEITVLLSLAVFLLVVAEVLPPSSETFPYIAIYFGCSMLLVSLSCLMTVIVLNLHFHGADGVRMPQWVRDVFLDGLGQLMCLKRRSKPSPQQQHVPTVTMVVPQQQDHIKMNNNTETHGPSENIPNGHIVQHDILNRPDIQELDPSSLNFMELDHEQSSGVYHTLQKQLEVLKNMEDYMINKISVESCMEEWQMLARVLDRFFLIIFLAIQFATTAWTLLQTYQSRMIE